MAPAPCSLPPSPQERVNADLMTYKGVLSKLEAAKEIMKASAEGWAEGWYGNSRTCAGGLKGQKTGAPSRGWRHLLQPAPASQQTCN